MKMFILAKFYDENYVTLVGHDILEVGEKDDGNLVVGKEMM